MVIVETSFPRGGTIKQRDKSQEIVFGARQEKRKKDKTKKKGNSDENAEVATDIKAVSAELLCHKTIHEGMVIMGTVKRVDPTFLKVSLPGRIVGTALASAISDSYNKQMRKYVDGALGLNEVFATLPDLFRIGQTVVAKVTGILNDEHGRLNISLSLKPPDIQSQFSHQLLRKGQIVFGAIEEVQDHGYVIETGVPNLRCFLPYEKSNEGFHVGQVLCMKLEKLTQTSSASVAVCKLCEDGNRTVKDLTKPNLDYILPSSTVNFTVEKVLKDGLQGSIMNGTFTAYVNEHHLESALKFPEDYGVDSTIKARVLYVMPLTKFVYLSLRTHSEPESSSEFKRGDIVEAAKVHHIGTGGVIVNLDDRAKGLISFDSIKADYTGNYDEDEVFAKYKKNTTLKLRIMDHDVVDNLYICSVNPRVINEKWYTLEDLQPGDFVTATVKSKNAKGDYMVQIGNVSGLIEKIYLAATTGNLQDNSKIRCRVIWVNADRNIVYLTNRKEYMTETAKILASMNAIKINRSFIGTIVKVEEKRYIVRFFGNITGLLYKNRIPEHMQDETVSLYEGSTDRFQILSQKEERIVLGLAGDAHEVGGISNAIVSNIIENGLETTMVNSENEQVRCLVPVRLLSDFQQLVFGHLKGYNLEEEISVACLLKNIYSVRDVVNFQKNPVKLYKDVQVGDILKGWVKNVEGQLIEIMLPIRDYVKPVKVHLKRFLEQAIFESNVVLVPDQVVFVKVLSKENMTKTITVSAKLTNVWDCDLKSTAGTFVQYLNEVKKIKKRLKSKGMSIASLKVGERVSGSIKSRTADGDWIVELPDYIRGILSNNFVNKKQSFETGTEVNCCILWIDYSADVVYLSHNKKDMEHIAVGMSLPSNYQNSVGAEGKVLIKTDDFAICSLRKGQNPLIFVPARLHFNDFENSLIANLKEGEFYRLTFLQEKYPIAVPESTWRFWTKMGSRKRDNDSLMAEIEEVPKKKKKLLKNSPKKLEVVVRNSTKKSEKSEGNAKEKPVSVVQVIGDNVSVTQESNGGDSNESLSQNTEGTDSTEEDDSLSVNEETKEDHIQVKANECIVDETTRKNKRKRKKIKSTIDSLTLLPGPINFWSMDLESKPDAKKEQSESSDDESESNAGPKKKLSTVAKFKAAREEEARLRQIEENYANPNKMPETIDEFDRSVLANPNNSISWINYMVFHLQAAEIDKARSVARRALKSISFREEKELINIWVALLNLELRYGSQESFTETLKESTLCNDPYKIYTRCLQILSDAKKVQEICELVPMVTRKFKDKPDIWKHSASAFFEIGLVDKAKQLLNKALNTLPEREHINTIVAFANLNYKYGDKETAHTLLDQIVTSYPKRVDIWSQYVDMLVKDGEIESGRRTLDRAVSQKIPIKKMRTLFKKYLDFEEKFGNEETVENVKQMAANYVKNEIS